MRGIRPEGYRPEQFQPQSLELTEINVYDFSETKQRLQQVKLHNEIVSGFYPYRQSSITLESVYLDQLHPCALYILEPQLNILTRLRSAFLDQKLDIFNLKTEQTMVNYHSNGLNWTLSPPVVEVSEDDNHKLIIVDGLHRMLLAKKLGLTATAAIKIKNPAVPLPVLPVGWKEIQSYEAVPLMEEKRRFRFKSTSEIREWIIKNPSRFMQGFSFFEKDNLNPDYFFYRDLSNLGS